VPHRYRTISTNTRARTQHPTGKGLDEISIEPTNEIIDDVLSAMLRRHDRPLRRLFVVANAAAEVIKFLLDIPNRIVYTGGGLALRKLGRKRERWATRLNRAKLAPATQINHSNRSGSPLVTLAKLELPQYTPTSTSGLLISLCVKGM
jgi:hypothetical protein